VPKVGQWGQLCLRVFRYKQVYNQIKTTQTPQLELLIQLYNVTTMRYTKRYNIHKIQDIQERKISHPRAKHAPSGCHPTWTAFTGNLTTQALKD
jgi:hypothetical protein